MPVAYLTRIARFNAAHRYYRPEWSESENRRVFGACANPHGHGHNYVLEVMVEGEIDAQTGFCADLAQIDALIASQVIATLDHQHLNHAIPEFADGAAIPTSENILAYCWARLAPALPSGARLYRLRLHEDTTFFVDYYGGVRID